MTWFLKLQEAINTPIINVHPEKQPLHSQIIALKCYFVIGNLDFSPVNQRSLTLFLAFISQCFIQPYLPLNFFTIIFEPLLFALPFFQQNHEYVPSFVILTFCCFIHRALELAVDLCLIFSFLINIALTLSRNATYWNYRWELLVIAHVLYISGIEGLFNILMLLTCWSAFLQPVRRRLNVVFFTSFILLQIAGDLFGKKISLNAF
ncbi:unnamed protein product [Larinioides sclopetarius]|uniref:Uncharacterized protein n=1 Tax=Larinioides sclopetarius TaxID=280406 RepID=A0AAV2A2Y5_9ARAC